MSAEPEITAITCHHRGNLVRMYDDSIHKSFGVTFESLIISSDPDIVPSNYQSRVISAPEHPFPASKRNFGADQAKGKYLAFFDDDVEVNPNCLYEMKKHLDENPTTGMVFSKLLNMEHRNRFDEAGSYLTWTGFLWSRAAQHIEDKGQYDYVEPILSGKSAACMIHTELFFKIAKFDEDFGILGEETDLAWRVWLSGMWVMFTPKAVAYHAFNTKFKPRDKFYTDTRVYYNGCRNYITLLIKNLGALNLCKILPVHLMVWLIAMFAMIFTWRIVPGWKILLGILHVLRNLPSLIRKRNAVQKQRVKSDRDIWPFVVCQPPRGYYTQRLRKYISSSLHG